MRQGELKYVTPYLPFSALAEKLGGLTHLSQRNSKIPNSEFSRVRVSSLFSLHDYSTNLLILHVKKADGLMVVSRGGLQTLGSAFETNPMESKGSVRKD